MSDIDFEKLLSAASNPQTESTLKTATSLVTQAESTFKTAEKWMNLIERAVAMAEHSGALAPLVRIVGKSQGLDPESIDRPLAGSNMIMPASHLHWKLFEGLNTLNQDQIREVSQLIVAWEIRKNDAEKKARIEDEPEEVRPANEAGGFAPGTARN